jgi:hypothetical protein
MTSLVTERFGAPSSAREIRMADFARRRAVDELAGRTVWCASALREGRPRARRLRASLRWAHDDGVVARELQVTGSDELREAARAIEALLAGAARAAAPGPAESEIYASDSGREAMLGDEVRPGDIVVLHDALTAALVEAVRERGAHAVWTVQPRGRRRTRSSAEAMRFLQVHLAATDAYLVTWRQDVAHSVLAQAIGALMPSPDMLTAKEIGERADGDLALGCLIADVVHDDRGERVGGTRHARPIVAAH